MGKAQILVIDDDRSVLSALRAVLEQAGYEVITAYDGSLGLRYFLDRQPDLAIVDITMPGMDGLEVIQRIRAAEGDQAGTPIIVCSAHDHAAFQQTAATLGASAYFIKPLTPAELVAAVQQLLTSGG
jgi:DNA-binding response OmpR family regulator